MGALLDRLVDNRDPRSVAARLRRARFRLFRDLAAPLPRPVRVLDVGGTPVYWRTMGITEADGYQITLLNRSKADVSESFLSAESGDARDLSRYADRSFDVVYSNSVIEHLGDLASQRRMAEEIRRVGRAYYVQTPNRGFPIEPHFLVPWFQFWPRGLQLALVRRFDLGWYKKQPDPARAKALLDEHRLLDEGELRALFPGATIHHERFLGLTKSLIAVG